VTFLLALALCCGVMVGFAGKAFAGYMHGNFATITDTRSGKQYEGINGIDNYGGCIYGETALCPLTEDAAIVEIRINVILKECDSYYGTYWDCYETGWWTNIRVIPKDSYLFIDNYYFYYDPFYPNNWWYYYCQGQIGIYYNAWAYADLPMSPKTLAD